MPLLLVVAVWSIASFAAPPPPRLSSDFELLQNSSFFQFEPTADGWMIGTGSIHTANAMGFGLWTHWVCYGVAPAEGAILNRYDLNASFFLSAFRQGEPQRCVRLPLEPPQQPDPWAFLGATDLLYVGPGEAECGPTDAWSTSGPANMSAVAVCRGSGRPAFVSQYTPRYFSGGSVLQWRAGPPPRSLFEVPAACSQ